MPNALGNAVLTRIFPWVMAALLLAPGGATVLAQQRNDLQRLKAGTVFRDCSYCPEMVAVPPGKLSIDPPEGEIGQADSVQTPHSVEISRALGVGRYEVTRAQFARFAQESGHAASGGCYAWNGGRYEQDAAKDWRKPGFAQTDRDPVVCVNWGDAKAYAEWLSKKTGRRYRLLTEAEWEYAARAGNKTLWPWGGNARDACRYANVADAAAQREVPGTASWTFHACNDRHAYTAPAGSYRPNAFGLYDMSGNAWEWTEDCLQDDYPAPPPEKSSTPADGRITPADGRGTPAGACRGQRVLRGGSWVDSPLFLRYDFRFRIGEDDRDFYIGFRVARPE